MPDYIDKDRAPRYVPCILNGTPGKRYRNFLKVAFPISDISHKEPGAFCLTGRASDYQRPRIAIDRCVELTQRARNERMTASRYDGLPAGEAGVSTQTLKRKQNDLMDRRYYHLDSTWATAQDGPVSAQ
ncbi:MAG: hypothetical protein EPN73_00580 [Paraburkholderia sp.]|uniref:hypothetical protein n=1 Tax=Paraburkholderia sp. TaxID=1926495 RepID=UPI00121E2B99|nr:hypothetical protein [Paraburkholderia sp.]TAL99082.1 MAG: hypothetical protein EPN73_00580 [Paraburkholderia sp.]